MTKINSPINYDSAMKDLLKGLKFSREMSESDYEYKYANALGRLESALKTHLVVCTDMSYEQVLEASKPEVKETNVPTLDRHLSNPDDITPTGLLHGALNWKEEDTKDILT